VNDKIRKVGLVSALLMLALLVNLTYTELVRQPDLEQNPRNLRARIADYNSDRGQILAGETVIAQSTPTDDNSGYRFTRNYPDGPLYAPVTGFFTIPYGFAADRGVEYSYNAQLSGTASQQWIERVLDQVTGRAPQGGSVVTTISPKLQQAAATALGSHQGAVVAMDPHTGAIRALVTSPSYDPNELAGHNLTAVQAAWNTLINDPTNPMSDRATKEVFPPGSTFKLVDMAAALEAGMTPDTLVDAPDALPYPNSTAALTNSSPCGNTAITLDVALQKSCNTAFANLVLQLGVDKVRDQAAKFGFGSAPLPDLQAVASRFPGASAIVDDGDVMRAAVGQGDVVASPLQMALIVAAIANDGQQPTPYIVEQVRSPSLTTLTTHTVATHETLSQASAQVLQQMMVNVVEKGTGTPARVPGLTIGGKTGTAEHEDGQGNKLAPYAWFVGFSQNPDLVVAVFVQDAPGENTEMHGGQTAGPIAKAVFTAARG